MDTNNLPFIILQSTENILAPSTVTDSNELKGKKLRTLLILERLVDELRISIAEGYSEEQATDYRSRENNIRQQIVDYAETLEKDVRESVLNGFGDDPYYKSVVMMNIKGSDSNKDTPFLDDWKSKKSVD